MATAVSSVGLLSFLLTFVPGAVVAGPSPITKGNALSKAPKSMFGMGHLDMEDEESSAFVAEEDETAERTSVVGAMGDISSAPSSRGESEPVRTRRQTLDSAIDDWDMGFDDDREGATQQPGPMGQLVSSAGGGDDHSSGSQSAVASKPPISWKAHGCYISKGGDILGSPRKLTVLEAKQLCAQTPDCKGFTYNSGTAVAPRKRRPVYFKDKFDCGGKGAGWTALRKVERTGEVVVPRWKQKPLAAPWQKPLLAAVRETFNVTVLSTSPPIWQFDDFLSEAETFRIRQTATPMLEEVAKPVSTAASAARSVWLSREEDLQDPLIQAVEARVAAVVNLPAKNQEPAQVLHYDFGDGYTLHHDRLETQSRQPCGVRVATFLIYLGEADGGETHFPELGVRVTPVPGRAVLWWNVDPARIEAGLSHEMDRRTVHEALPVQTGEKWAVNKWIHMLDFQTPYFARALK